MVGFGVVDWETRCPTHISWLRILPSCLLLMLGTSLHANLRLDCPRSCLLCFIYLVFVFLGDQGSWSERGLDGLLDEEAVDDVVRVLVVWLDEAADDFCWELAVLG